MAERIQEPQRNKLTPVSAHPVLKLVDDYADNLLVMQSKPFGTQAYYAALVACDTTWEAIADAVLNRGALPAGEVPHA